MSVLTPDTFTSLFHRWRGGDQEAGDELFQLIYQDLLRLAQGYLQGDRVGQVIQAQTLVHETYLRLFGKEKVDVECRGHFFVLATRQMRRILIDQYRRNGAAILGRHFESLSHDELLPPDDPKNVDLIALDEALGEFELMDERACRVVELRFISGFSEKEAAEILGISVATLKRDWTAARTWLYGRLHGEAERGHPVRAC
jgi:RNA polymerase sigma-70 factor, ECF subfamily